MSEYATRFDPALVSAADGARVVEDAAAIKNMAATVEALAAARVAETGRWKRDGDRSAHVSWPYPRPRPLPAGVHCRLNRWL